WVASSYLKRVRPALAIPWKQIDTTGPNTARYFCAYTATTGDSVRVTVYLNSTEQEITFDVPEDPEVLAVAGVKHAVRGKRHLAQGGDSRSYGDQCTALFMGSFSMPYNVHYPNREDDDTDDSFSTTFYPFYDKSKHWFDIQNIYILLEGDPKLADKIIGQI